MINIIYTSIGATCTDVQEVYQSAGCCNSDEDTIVSNANIMPEKYSWNDLSSGGIYKVGISATKPKHKNSMLHVLKEMKTENVAHGIIPGFTKLFMMAEPLDTLVPLIVKSNPLINTLSNGKINYKFDLQNDIHWSDNTLITSDDVKYSFDIFKTASGTEKYAKRITDSLKDLEIEVLSQTIFNVVSPSRLSFNMLRPLLQMPIFPKSYWYQFSSQGISTALEKEHGNDAPLAAPFLYSESTSESIIWLSDKKSYFSDLVAYRYCMGGGVTMLDPKYKLSEHDYDGGCTDGKIVHFGPHVDSVEFHYFNNRGIMFDSLSNSTINHAIHTGSNWEGVPASYKFHKEGFASYRNTGTTIFNLLLDQGPGGTNFPANNKAFRQVMACMTKMEEIYDAEKHEYSGSGKVSRYYDDIYSEITSAMGNHDNWKDLGFYEHASGVFKTCGETQITNRITGNIKDLNTSREILKNGGWKATNWGGVPNGNFVVTYSGIKGLSYNEKTLEKNLRLHAPNTKPYRLNALLQTQLGMDELGIDVIVKPNDFTTVNYCTNTNDPNLCTEENQFRVLGLGEPYPFDGDIPKLLGSLFDSKEAYSKAVDHPYDEHVKNIRESLTLLDVKKAVRDLQVKLHEDVPLIPMFKYKYKDVFYRTAIPYEKVYFGGYHTGATLGGFSSIVKVF